MKSISKYFAALILATFAFAVPASAQVYHGTAGCTTIGITDGNTNLIYTVYAVTVPNVKAGETFLVIGEMHARNDASYNVEFLAYLAATPNKQLPCADFDPSYSWEGLLAGQSPNGQNVSPTMHYGNPHHAAMWTAPADAAYVVFHYRARARSSMGNGSANMPALPGQGFLQVRRF